MREVNDTIFLSYSHADKSQVDQFVNSLDKHKINVWYDMKNIQAGDRWQNLVENALRESPVLVAVLSKSSIESPWMFFELGAAVADKKRVIPVLIEGLNVQDLPSLLAQFQVVAADDPNTAGEIVANAIVNLNEKAVA